MSSNNDNGGGGVFLLALFLAGLYILAAVLFAALLFVALIMTLLALCALDGPYRLFGCWITPEEARAFLGRGIVGAILLPCFALFCALLFEFRVPDGAWFYLVTGGYSLGSVVLGIWLDSHKSETLESVTTGPAHIEATPSTRERLAPPSPTSRAVPSQEEPFRFASWDDEAELNDR